MVQSGIEMKLWQPTRQVDIDASLIDICITGISKVLPFRSIASATECALKLVLWRNGIQDPEDSPRYPRDSCGESIKVTVNPFWVIKLILDDIDVFKQRTFSGLWGDFQHESLMFVKFVSDFLGALSRRKALSMSWSNRPFLGLLLTQSFLVEQDRLIFPSRGCNISTSWVACSPWGIVCRRLQLLQTYSDATMSRLPRCGIRTISILLFHPMPWKRTKKIIDKTTSDWSITPTRLAIVYFSFWSAIIYEAATRNAVPQYSSKRFGQQRDLDSARDQQVLCHNIKIRVKASLQRNSQLTWALAHTSRVSWNDSPAVLIERWEIPSRFLQVPCASLWRPKRSEGRQALLTLPLYFAATSDPQGSTSPHSERQKKCEPF